MVNKEDQPVEEIHFVLPDAFDVAITIADAELSENNEEIGYQIFTLASPLQVGDSLAIQVTSSYQVEGIENQLTLPNLTQNGIFINNSSFLLVIGYAKNREITNKDQREEQGLYPRVADAKLSRDCETCVNHFISQDADWVKASFTISTSEEQIAIAPGKLTKSWQERGRNYYTYELDKPVINFYAFLSARYEVKREKWNGIDLEVYYHEPHDYNVDKMMASMKTSLSYYTKAFAPYPHDQARIIEFPRFAKFAQAFPGTMPYSESLGFLANSKDKDDLDMVTHTVAHEMGHQWWAHQVIGGDVAGASMLSEALAQYSALQVMEKMYGKTHISKFLAYEMEQYLEGRGNTTVPEVPLNEVSTSQSYIFYNKGSVAMFALREYVGVDSINLALRRFYDKTAYTEGAYPTTLDLMDEFERVTPDSLMYLVQDFFKTITLYDNKVQQTAYEKLANGKYEVSVTFDVQKLRADSVGTETPVSVNDWIEVGVYGAEGKELLYSDFHRFISGENTLTFQTDEEPATIAIDPRHLLIDRFLDDNEKEIKGGEG